MPKLYSITSTGKTGLFSFITWCFYGWSLSHIHHTKLWGKQALIKISSQNISDDKLIKISCNNFVFRFPKNPCKRSYQSCPGTINAPQIQRRSVPVNHTTNTEQQNCTSLSRSTECFKQLTVPESLRWQMFLSWGRHKNFAVRSCRSNWSHWSWKWSRVGCTNARRNWGSVLEEWETDNESNSTLPASTESWQPPEPVLESWEPPDPGFNRIINESDLDSEDKVNFGAVIDQESPINCPFMDYEAVESEEGSEITNSEEEEAIPPHKRGQRT